MALNHFDIAEYRLQRAVDEYNSASEQFEHAGREAFARLTTNWPQSTPTECHQIVAFVARLGNYADDVELEIAAAAQARIDRMLGAI